MAVSDRHSGFPTERISSAVEPMWQSGYTRCHWAAALCRKLANDETVIQRLPACRISAELPAGRPSGIDLVLLAGNAALALRDTWMLSWLISSDP